MYVVLEVTRICAGEEMIVVYTFRELRRLRAEKREERGRLARRSRGV